MFAHENSGPRSWRQTILKVAIQALGRASVAQGLNVPALLLDDWLEDPRDMPAWKLSMLLDLVEAENVSTT